MLSASLSHPVLGLSDTARPLILIVFVVFMFGAAGLAVAVGKRRQDAAQAHALSADTGSDRGAMRGADTTFSDEWLAETRSEDVTEAPKQSWHEAILGPGSVHHHDLIDDVAPAEASTAPAAPSAPKHRWAAPAADASAAPAYPVSTPPATTATPVAPVAPVAPVSAAPFLVDDFLDDED